MFSHYVAQTKNAQEALAHDEIRSIGFESIWFSIQEEIRTRHGRHFKTVSLFPNYLFIGFDYKKDNWERIANCRGVQNILGSDPVSPFPLPLGTVEAIRLRFDAGEFSPAKPVLIEVEKKPLLDLETLKVKAGVSKLSRGERIKVLMTFFGAEREVTIRGSRTLVAV